MLKFILQWKKERIYCKKRHILFLFVSGHFTQVVWEQSVELGVAFTAFKNGPFNKVMVVANYYLAGNVMGVFKASVKPPVKN